MPTDNPHLISYLNDHLAGATAGLELLEHIASVYTTEEVGRDAHALHGEVSEDRATLERLMDRLDARRSTLRQASGWVGEKLVRLKLRLDDPDGGAFHLMESLEAMSLGIEGKRLLWVALTTASETNPDLRGTDYAELVRRAEGQRQRVETWRRDAARRALSANNFPQK